MRNENYTLRNITISFVPDLGVIAYFFLKFALLEFSYLLYENIQRERGFWGFGVISVLLLIWLIDFLIVNLLLIWLIDLESLVIDLESLVIELNLESLLVLSDGLSILICLDSLFVVLNNLYLLIFDLLFLNDCLLIRFHVRP